MAAQVMTGIAITATGNRPASAVGQSTMVRDRKFNSALFGLIFLSYYLEISIYSNQDLVFPFFATTVLAFGGLATNLWAVRRAHIILVALIVAAIWASTFITYAISERPLAKALLSTVQISVAIATSYAVFIVAGLSNRRWTSNIMLGFAAVILVGSIAERFPIVKDTSDYVRSLIYPSSLLYDADRRDLLQYGVARPRFFTREPSLVGINLGFSFCIGILLSNFDQAKKVIMLIGAGLVTFYFVRSPASILFVAIGLYAIMVVPPVSAHGRTLGKWVSIAIIAVIFLLAPLVTLAGSALGIDSRYFLGGGSYFMRIFGPPLVFKESLTTNPMFGYGLGSFEQLLPMVRKVYSEAGAYSLFPFFRSAADASVLMSNAFWEYWIFFGLFGGALLVWLFSNLWRELGLRMVFFPFVALALSLQTFGGISAFRPWFFLFSFAALEYLMRRPFTAIPNSR